MATGDNIADTTVRITRVFKAPLDRVFKAFIDPTILRQWWCPEGYHFTDVTIDPKTGRGKRYTMVGPGGDKYVWEIDYQLIEDQRKLKWTSTPIEGFGEAGVTRCTVAFREVPGGTEVSLTHEGHPDKDTRDAHQGGWSGSFEKLNRLLAAQGK
jgi:uncharacterized protein YndB with AHSA1/START domain